MNKNQFIKISQWQKETFGQATALSKMAHLKEEIEELTSELKFAEAMAHHFIDSGALQEEIIRHEFADCFILLFGAASSHGMNYEDICKCIEDKHGINLNRDWGKPDSNGVVHHVKKD